MLSLRIPWAGGQTTVAFQPLDKEWRQYYSSNFQELVFKTGFWRGAFGPIRGISISFLQEACFVALNPKIANLSITPPPEFPRDFPTHTNCTGTEDSGAIGIRNILKQCMADGTIDW